MGDNGGGMPGRSELLTGTESTVGAGPGATASALPSTQEVACCFPLAAGAEPQAEAVASNVVASSTAIVDRDVRKIVPRAEQCLIGAEHTAEASVRMDSRVHAQASVSVPPTSPGVR